MSIARMTGVWEDSQQGGTDLVMLLALADFADDDGFCWPSANTLAKKTRVSRRQVFRVLAGLSEAGELAILPRNAPRSNCYVILIGNSRSAIDRSLIRGGTMGVGKSDLKTIRELLEQWDRLDEYDKVLAQLDGDNLTPSEDTSPSGEPDGDTPSDRGDAGVTIDGDIDVTRSVSSDPSVEPPEKESAADAAPEKDDGWLDESRIKGKSQLETMTPEERAEVGAPGGSTDLSPTAPPGDPPWAAKWRELLRPRYTHGLTMDHIIGWIARFAGPAYADLPVPTDRGGAADWHGGALAFHRHVALDLAGAGGLHDDEVDLLCRRANFCLDLFYWRRDQGHGYYQHEVTRPASLSNKTVVALARDLRKMQTRFGLNDAVMPTEDKIKAYYNQGEKEPYDQRQLTDEDRDKIRRTIVRGQGAPDPSLDLLRQRDREEASQVSRQVEPG